MMNSINNGKITMNNATFAGKTWFMPTNATIKSPHTIYAEHVYSKW
jgi:hypothetical protein